MLKFQRCCLGVIIALQGQIELEIILMVLQVSSENVKAGCNRISFFCWYFIVCRITQFLLRLELKAKNLFPQHPRALNLIKCSPAE
jgi:hypothetical protein